MEADFLREYQIDLMDQLDTLSWRRFCALLAGLSPQSAFVNVLAQAKPHRPTPARTLSDPRAIAASIRNIARRR